MPNGGACALGGEVRHWVWETSIGLIFQLGVVVAFLATLESVIEKRIAESPQGSYTARLFSEGPKRIAQKVGEEGLEVALAAVVEADDKLLSESADLIFHLLVLLRSRGLSFQGIVSELQSRHATKG